MRRIILFTTLALLFIVGCSKENEIQPKKKLNPNPAQNNDDINYQRIFGEKQSSIWNTITIDDEVYAVGYQDGQNSLLKISGAGRKLWSKTIDIKPKDFIKTRDNNIIVVGTKGNNGGIRLYDLNGNLLDAKNIDSKSIGTVDLYLNAICFTNNGFYMIGGATKDKNTGKITPFFQNVLVKNNKINESTEYTVSEEIFSGCSVRSIKYNSEGDFIVLMNKYLGDKNKSVIIAKFGIVIDKEVVSLVLDWYKEVVNSTNLASWSGRVDKQLIITDDKIFSISNTEAVKKPAPTGGGYWDSGFVFCLDFKGNVLWKKVIQLSNKADKLWAGIFSNSNLYIVGIHSDVIYNDEIRRSNGLLVKMDKYGEVVYTKTFGEKNKLQGFNTVEMIDGKLKMLGYSGSGENSDFRNWFVEVNP